MIFCTHYQPEGWYTRIDPNSDSGSPVSEVIMDRIIHNACEVLVEGRVSMRERNGLKSFLSRDGSCPCGTSTLYWSPTQTGKLADNRIKKTGILWRQLHRMPAVSAMICRFGTAFLQIDLPMPKFTRKTPKFVPLWPRFTGLVAYFNKAVYSIDRFGISRTQKKFRRKLS